MTSVPEEIPSWRLTARCPKPDTLPAPIRGQRQASRREEPPSILLVVTEPGCSATTITERMRVGHQL
jgi:hypothetical protein